MKEKSLSEKAIDGSESRSELKLLFRKQKSVDSSGEHLKIQRSKSFQNLQDRPTILSDLIHELELTGFKSCPDPSKIFEPNGELFAHFNCAAWSEGVTKTFEKKLSNVDKAVVSAVFQKCSKCRRFGASVKCCFSDCSKIYHYPCAIVSGALQNANCFKIICSVHREHAFSFGVLCMACHESGDLSQLILCTSCGNYYHGNCMDPAIAPSPDVRAGWQCLDCKVCQNCRQPEDVTNKMLVCSSCDKGFHICCLKPALTSVPKSGWKCYACRKCGDCGARTPGNGPSSRWHMNYTVCDSCYQQRNKGIACPLCKKAYRQFSQRKAMKHCSICQKYIHDECDRRVIINPIDYICPICINSGNQILDDNYAEHHIKDSSFQGSSRDSFVSGNEESQSSEESDCIIESVTPVPSNKITNRRTSSENRPRKPAKPRLKNLPSQEIFFPMSQLFSQKEYKIDDDDPTEDNRMVISLATDEFVLCQDLCVMCGSFGKGDEGKLVACAQCGQCYHSYCASIKVTMVVLKKGWRCLDCTVCEGCGQPHDEGRLLLCDECDISFHIYCLDPPLQEVPQGNWKCKW